MFVEWGCVYMSDFSCWKRMWKLVFCHRHILFYHSFDGQKRQCHRYQLPAVTCMWLLSISTICSNNLIFDFWLNYPRSHAQLPRESLLKGKDLYSWPPCTNKFRSVIFILKLYFSFFTKHLILMRRSTVLNLPLQLGCPACREQGQLFSKDSLNYSSLIPISLAF